MKTLILALCSLITSLPSSANPLLNYFTLDKTVSAEVGVILPPKEIQMYQRKIQVAADSDPDWFTEYRKSVKSGLPYPFHEKMGMSKSEYDDYLKLWEQRKFQVLTPVEIKLTKNKDGEFTIIGAGPAAKFSLFKYQPKSDTFSSLKGKLNRIKDIKAEPLSILGQWTGQEWKLQKTDDYATLKENIAIGKLADSKNGILIYRFQEISQFAPFQDSILIRFPLK